MNYSEIEIGFVHYLETEEFQDECMVFVGDDLYEAVNEAEEAGWPYETDSKWIEVPAIEDEEDRFNWLYEEAVKFMKENKRA